MLPNNYEGRITVENRLTVKNSMGQWVLKRPQKCSRCDEIDWSPLTEGGEDIAARLAHYEEAEEQGLLILLPGKTIFYVTWDAGKNCDLACPIDIEVSDNCDFCDKADLFIYERKCTPADLGNIGYSAYLTKEEAEAQLQKCRQNVQNQNRGNRRE